LAVRRADVVQRGRDLRGGRVERAARDAAVAGVHGDRVRVAGVQQLGEGHASAG